MRYDLRAMGVGAILDRALRIYLQNFWILLAISLVFSVPVAALYMFLADSNAGTGLEAVMTAAFLGFGIALGVMSILQGTLVQAVSDIYLGIPASVGRSLRMAGSRLFPLIAGTFLYMLITSIGIAFCILPGLVLMGALFALVPIIVLERRGPIEALTRSFELSSGMRRRAFAAIFFGQFQSALVAYAVAIPARILEIGPFRTQALTHMAVAVVQPYPAIVLILLYYDLRVRREAFDLQVLAVEMGGAGTAPPAAPAP